VRADGTSITVQFSIAALLKPGQEPSEFIAIGHDMTDRRRLEETLRHQALHDPLTGLPNRALFQEQLGQALYRASSTGESLAVLLVDLDRFKEVNDTFGHDFGDTLLCEVGTRCLGLIRGSDTLARLGGDEFGLVLSATNERGATGVASTLLSALTEPFLIEGRAIQLGCSIGVAVHPGHGDDTGLLVRRADVAMYDAKRTASGYSVYDVANDPYSAERMELAAGLSKAIKLDQLTLYFQPKINVKTGGADRAEALVRWIHPDRGMVPPDQFIDLAERTGLIRPLTMWVLRCALRQARAWHDAGSSIKVAVNLSIWNLQDPGLVDTVQMLLAETMAPPTSLIVEITESALMADPARAQRTVAILHDLGIRIAIDDFGTGYSSLAYLRRIKVDEIKIDRSFVTDMKRADDDAAIIVRSVVDLGHNLNLQVVAEGVETQWQLDILTVMGCDFAQGYHLGAPMPREAYEEWRTNWVQRSELGTRISPRVSSREE
jgi:diguanylate cyclase (GGDEF)-like protein